MSLANKLAAKMGADGVQRAKNSKIGKILRRRGVMRTAEFERIKALRRRDWQEGIDDAFLAAATDYFKTPAGVMSLWPMQAAALAEAHDNRGLFLGAGVGTGKTLVSLLLPVALQAERPLLFVPASLRDKTIHTDMPMLTKHWHLHPGLQVFSYDALSRESGAELLQTLRPDLIICDEAHRLAYKSSARTRRFLRYFGENPDTRLVVMSGTVSRKSLMDYSHLIKLALRAAPLPTPWHEVQDWADALDEKLGNRERLAPGVLLDLCAGGESPRQGYQRRLCQTPGVIITSKTSCPASINLNRINLAVPQAVLEALRHLITEWETPGGEYCTEALELFRHGRELSCGFYYRWVWPHGVVNQPWLGARKAWRTFVRETIRHNRRGLDSELQVAGACAKGTLPNAAYEAWVAVRDEYKPVTEPVWLDDFLMQHAASWAQGQPSLVWVEHDAVGRKLASTTFDDGRSMFYFGQGASQAEILAHVGSSVILSSHSHREGKNLQAWSHNIVVSASPSGAAWDQMLGRTHREGQTADEVGCDIYLHTEPLLNGFIGALADAKYLQDTLGQEQKLLYATRSFAVDGC